MKMSCKLNDELNNSSTTLILKNLNIFKIIYIFFDISISVFSYNSSHARATLNIQSISNRNR